jgi:hypothetical protein
LRIECPIKWCMDENGDKLQSNSTDDCDNIVPAKVLKRRKINKIAHNYR